MSTIRFLPKTFFSDIICDLEPKLKEFYNFYESEISKSSSGYEDLCTEILTDALDGRSDQLELNRYYNEKKKQWKRKKVRWLKQLKDASTGTSITDADYPFPDIIFLYWKRQDKWKAIYGDLSLEDAIKEEISKSEAWAENENSFFIDFPAIGSKTPKQRLAALKDDILLSCFNVLKTKYNNMDLSEFILSYVDEMGGAYFADNGKWYRANDKNKGYVGEIPISEDGSSKLEVIVSKEAFGDNAVTSMLDDKDQRILFDIIKRASVDIASGDRPLLIELGELAKVLSKNGRPTKYHYQEAQDRCFKITNFSYNEFVDGKQVGAVNFLSAAHLDAIDGKKYMRISLGSTVSDAIINNKVRRIPSASYDSLTNKTARILVLSFQRERIKACVRAREQDPESPAITSFRYNDFLFMVNFGGNNKRKNIRTIKDALSDFKEHEVLVEDFDYNTSSAVFTIRWSPLSKAEWEDLSWYGYDDADIIVDMKDK